MIELILLERIERLGSMGQVVKVRPGFARNYLLPQKKALRATKANLELFEKQRAELEAKNAALRSQAKAAASKMENVKLIVIRQASETGQLYGSVSARDVAEAAKDAKQNIERNMVVIDTPIKALGLYQVKVKLHPEVSVKVTVNVARSPEEAAIQAEKGAAVAKAAAKAEAIEEKAAEAEASTESKETAEAPAPKKTRKPRTKKTAEEE